jgi:hypothetical protein
MPIPQPQPREGAMGAPRESDPNSLRRPWSHRRFAENLDGNIDRGSNHPKMNGKTALCPLKTHHPMPPAPGEQNIANIVAHLKSL